MSVAEAYSESMAEERIEAMGQIKEMLYSSFQGLLGYRGLLVYLPHIYKSVVGFELWNPAELSMQGSYFGITISI